MAEFRNAAEQGDAEAQFKVGQSYYKGNGVEKDLVEATKWLRKAADQGDAKAQTLLGCCYADDNYAAKDMTESIKWIRKAADQGFAKAQSILGMFYCNGIGVEKDMVEAAKWFSKAAEQGDATAQNSLGGCYYFGNGIAIDKVEAVKWFSKAAEQGECTSQFMLAFCYVNGDGGVKQDIDEAEKWYRKSAEQGFAAAQYALGVLYAGGARGIEKNDAEAVKWFQKAAAQGDANSQVSLAISLEKTNPTEALKYARLAAAKGSPIAKGIVEYLGFDIVAVKARADKQKNNTLVFKNLWLGMPIEDACQTINQKVGKRFLSVTTDKESKMKIIALIDGTNEILNRNYIDVLADESGKVTSFFLHKEIIDALFDSKDMPQSEFIQTFINNYKIPKLEPELREVKVGGMNTIGDEKVVGFQQIYYYRSPKGFEITFYEEPQIKNISDVSKARMAGFANYSDAGSILLKKIGTAKARESKFD